MKTPQVPAMAGMTPLGLPEKVPHFKRTDAQVALDKANAVVVRLRATPVMCNGYRGAIVRHYDGATYEVRVPGGVVATDDFTVITQEAT